VSTIPHPTCSTHRREPAPGFGATLAELRASRGLSQHVLADRLGVTHSTVSRWESGDRAPRPRRLQGIVRALDLTSEEHTRLGMAWLMGEGEG